MGYQFVFKRQELKYLITRKQKDIILKTIEPYMENDKYGPTTIRNLYFDTDSYLLIRRSIEKPIYKEKLRVRSYKQAKDHTTVFVELKKKYNKVVYKRRIPLKEKEAMMWLLRQSVCPIDTQIGEELNYCLDFYKNLHPTVFLSYQREAYYCKDNTDLRITFDDHVLFREDDLSLQSDIYGTPLLNEDQVLMEIKTSGSIPLWLVDILSKEHIYKISFSKYGTAYKQFILPRLKEEMKNV